MCDNRCRIIEFKKYCSICKFKDLEENKDPCNECLDYGANYESEKPVKFTKADDLEDKK